MAIFTAIGSLIAGALFAGSALAATVISSALAFGANLGFQYLNRPKKRKYTAVQGETQYGGDVPVGTLLGTGKTKGQRSFYAKFGGGNQVNAEVFLLANGWCDGLEPYVYFFGRKNNLVATVMAGNHVAAYNVEGYGAAILILFFDGRPGQGVETNLVANTAALGQTWKATSVNAGMAYVVVYRTYSADVFPQGKPEFEFVLRGLREYDPRKDSTVAGGSGPQRLNDPSTWVHTNCPAVHRLNYQLGLRAMISGRTLIGEGKSLGQIDLATYFVAMNVCDTVREGKPTYQCSLWVTGEDDHTEILKEFDDAMAGYGLNRRGLSGVIAGAPQIPVLEITADDIPIDRAKDIQYRKSAFERFNHLSGQFLSIEAMWSPESLTPVYVNADVAADGRNRQTSNDFLQVSDPDIAQYLLNIRYRQNRRGGTVTLPVSRRVGLRVQEGEWVTWRDRTWMISEWALDEQFRITLKLSEVDADIYDDGDIEPGPVVIPPTPPINPSLLSTVQNFDAEAGYMTGVAGYDVPVLRFTWDPPEDPTITAVRFFYKVDGTSDVFQDQAIDPDAGEYTTTKNVVSGKVYVAQATITTVPDRFKTFTPWVTTDEPTGMLSMLNDLAHVGADVRARLGELQEAMDRDLTERIADLMETFSLEGAVGQVRRDQMQAQLGDALAQIIEERRVRVSGDEALSQLLTSVTAQVADAAAAVIVEQTARVSGDTALSSSITALTAQTTAASAAILTEQTTRANADSALASSITQVQAQVDDVSADGYLAITATTAGSTLAKIELAARAALGDTAALAALVLDVTNVGGVLKTRMAAVADQFVIMNGDGSSKTYPFVFEGGVAKLANVNIENAIIGNLQVGTSNIVAGAVTSNGVTAEMGEITVAVGTEAVIAQVTVDVPAGGKVLISFNGTLSFQNGVPGSAAVYQLKIYRGATLLWTIRTAHPTTGVNTGVSLISGEINRLFPDLAAPAGTHTYSINYYPEAGFSVSPKIANRILIATVYKR